MSLSGNLLASRRLIVTFPVYVQRQCGSFLETPLAPLPFRELHLSGLKKKKKLLKPKRGFILWGEREIKQMHEQDVWLYLALTSVTI